MTYPTLKDFRSTVEDHRELTGKDMTLRDYLDNVARGLIVDAMRHSEGSIAQAAKLLNTNRTTLHMRFHKGIMKKVKR